MTSIELSQSAMAHVRTYVIAENAQALACSDMSKPVKQVLSRLFHLMALKWIFQYSGDFQIHGGLRHDHLKYLNEKMVKLLSEVRPVAVSLVDCFDHHDYSLVSTLGAYDGQVYTRMFDAALKSPLNKSDVLPAYDKYIKPILKANL